MNSNDNKSPQKNQCDSLEYFLDLYKNNPLLQSVSEYFASTEHSNNTQLIDVYNKAIPLIENLLWDNTLETQTNNLSDNLKRYQTLFHELETFHLNTTHDNRHHFIIAIPVADRPQHLKQCLESLLILCKHYRYGGVKNSNYEKLQVLIADDSKHLKNQQFNKKLAEEFTEKGIKVDYFGASEQQIIIKKIKTNNNRLNNIIGDIKSENFYHKGASITRNITYLKLNELRQPNQSTLFYFIDSDQEFQVKIKTKNDEKDVYAINYFYYLDKIFTKQSIDVLTGKVVGDPPVSPSVMAGNFLDDLIAFTNRIAKYDQQSNCLFHEHDSSNADDAAYHDMADLFGFKSSTESYQYHCMIKGQHDHAKCFSELCNKLSQFFDGEHPTRKSYYEHVDVENNIKPARTIYTGNYIFTENALQYFIPFANLKLRMAGPVLGRVIKSDIKDRFVSANLPMLHKRTINTINQSEFRLGVEHQHNNIDLSGEFIRQFYGDVMLFSMQALTDSGYPHTKLSDKTITDTVASTLESMKVKYDTNRFKNTEKIEKLKASINNPNYWWNTDENSKEAILKLNVFIHNIETNFGKNAKVYSIIFSDSTILKYQTDIANALINYPTDISMWNNTLFEKQN